jgi:hypothetical protein
MFDVRGQRMRARLSAIREVASERGLAHRHVFALIPPRRTAWLPNATSMASSHRTDAELIGATLPGNRDAFAEVVSRYQTGRGGWGILYIEYIYSETAAHSAVRRTTESEGFFRIKVECLADGPFC